MKLRYFSFLAGCFILFAIVIWGEGELRQKKLQEGIAGEIIRFHILANSDSEEDQAVKLEVRNEISAYMKELLDNVEGRNEAETVIKEHLPEICRKAGRVLKKENKNWPVKAEISTDSFPERIYGDCRFPAGKYRALRITLGEGKGHNWWCVMYPNLCFMDESCRIVSSETKEELKKMLTEDEYQCILREDCKKLRFRFRLAELFL